MKFGVREICDVVLKTKATQKIGNKIFYKNEPVIYFDTLKTSSLEGASTTVYAQGGKGNSRLVAWEGERTVTFTMEDALISSEGLSILTGAGLLDAKDVGGMKVHTTEQLVLQKSDSNKPGYYDVQKETVLLSYAPVTSGGSKDEDYIYVMKLDDNGDIVSEPVLAKTDDNNSKKIVLGNAGRTAADAPTYKLDTSDVTFDIEDTILIDYYRTVNTGSQIEITADKFAGNYYLEASTLFRDKNGTDLPAEFIIPNCKVQSNFTFTMASSGDPSTFTFTMDAFPDFTRFDHSKKVLAAIQIIEEGSSQDLHRHSTHHEKEHDALFR